LLALSLIINRQKPHTEYMTSSDTHAGVNYVPHLRAMHLWDLFS
jgi:hypothetical protein